MNLRARIGLLVEAQGARKAATDIDGVAKAVDKTGRESATAGRKMRRAKDDTKAWRKELAGVASVAAVGFAAVIGKQAVGAAVNLGEEMNKTRVVFRGSEDAMLGWSKNTAAALGISRRQALESAGVFGNMLVPMGFARKEAAGMSRHLVGLAADMASFNNASPEETLDAIRAGLAGETEPLRRYGVFLSQARIQAQAMSMGLLKATGNTEAIKTAQERASIAQQAYTEAVRKHGGQSMQARRAHLALESSSDALKKSMQGNVNQMTAAQKAQATYGLILKDTKDAQGDFGRTSGSLANKQRILKAQWENIQATLGTKLLPAVSAVANALSDFFSALQSGNPLAIAAVAVFAGLTAAVIAYAAAAAVAAISTAAISLPVLLIVAGLAALAVGFIYAYQKVGWFRHGVQATFGWVKGHWPLLLAIFTGPIGLAVLFIVRKWDGIVGFFRKLPGRLASAGRGMWDWIKDAFRNAINWVIGAWNGLNFHIGGTDLGPLGHLPDINIGTPDIPLLGAGGDVAVAGAAVVGDTGPEILELPAGARVSPLADSAERSPGRSRGRVGDIVLHDEITIDGRKVGVAVRRIALGDLLAQSPA